MTITAAPRRFYQLAQSRLAPGGYDLTLDQRPARTPQDRPLVLPTQALADLIALEWNAQVDTINYDSMPATRLAHTIVDSVVDRRAEVAASLRQYAAADLLCYFAPTPQSLVARQTEIWGGLLAWAQREETLAFATTHGLHLIDQPLSTLDAVEALALAMDDFKLGGWAFGAGLFGSVVLALALSRGKLDAKEAVTAARLDEAFQEETWGVDAEAAQRTARMVTDAAMLQTWFAALV